MTCWALVSGQMQSLAAAEQPTHHFCETMRQTAAKTARPWRQGIEHEHFSKGILYFKKRAW
jgi:hypothetical protein